jgi:hypothetical protein
MEHAAEPHKGDQHQLGAKERGDPRQNSPETSVEMRVWYPVCSWRE